MFINQEFKVNDYITLKLEDRKTNIYIKGILFRTCKFLLLNIPIEEITSFDEIESIDEAAEKLNNILDDNEGSELINPEVEFWGHCSNLQVWAEQNYNTQLLHSNLAFPLLKKLTEAGDPKALNIFKFEILRRFIEGSENTREFLNEQDFLEYLSEEEFRSPLSIRERSILEELEGLLQKKFIFAKNLEYITKLGVIERNNYYYYHKFKKPNIIGLRIFKEDVKKVPEIVADLKELKYLVMSDNYSEYLPESIGKLKKLEFLDLSVNKFKELPESYNRLNSLKFLDLYKNNFKEIPKILKNIKSLERLLLRENPIINFPNKFGALKRMEGNYYSSE